MTGKSDTDLISQLEALVIADKSFQELEGALRYFCPFEAMGMVDQEIRHAHFLAYILDPNRPHGFEDAYLRAFLHVAAEKALEAKAPLRPIDIHLMELGDAVIERERGRIDLRVEIPASKATDNKRVILIFELKINSGETKGQLKNYIAEMKREYGRGRLVFFFLTLDGDDPSEENRDDWYPLAMVDVIEKFSQISHNPVGHADAQSTVRSYITMMRRKHVGDQSDKLRELARDLWRNHKEALEFLVSAQPDDVSETLSELFSRTDFPTRLSGAAGLDFEHDPNSSQRCIILFPKQFDHINVREDGSRLLVLVIDRNYGDRDRLRLRWLLRPGDPERRSKIFDQIDGKKRKFTSDWTQIAVQRIPLTSDFNVEDLEAQVMAFAKNQAPRMAKLRG